MPDVTVTFTDAQWTRVVAASSYIKRIDESGDVDADYLAALWKDLVTDWVKAHEKCSSCIGFLDRQTMKSRNKIIRWRRRYPLMRPIDMARKLNVSRQYVYKILKKYDLPTSAPSQRKIRHCPICNDIVPTQAKVCPGRCRYEYTNIQVTCSFVSTNFT